MLGRQARSVLAAFLPDDGSPAVVKTALAYADDDDADLERRIRERLLLLELDRRYPCTMLDGLLPQGWESDPLYEAERALAERVSRELIAKDGLVLVVEDSTLMLSKVPAPVAEAPVLPAEPEADPELSELLSQLPASYRTHLHGIAAGALRQLERGESPTVPELGAGAGLGPTPLRDTDGVRRDQVAAWQRLVAAAEVYRGVWGELRDASRQAHAAGIDDDVLRAWMSAAIGRPAMLYVTTGKVEAGRQAQGDAGEAERLGAEIDELKRQLESLIATEQAEEYNELFARLVELEQRRRGL